MYIRRLSDKYIANSELVDYYHMVKITSETNAVLRRQWGFFCRLYWENGEPWTTLYTRWRAGGGGCGCGCTKSFHEGGKTRHGFRRLQPQNDNNNTFYTAEGKKQLKRKRNEPTKQ